MLGECLGSQLSLLSDIELSIYTQFLNHLESLCYYYHAKVSELIYWNLW